MRLVRIVLLVLGVSLSMAHSDNITQKSLFFCPCARYKRQHGIVSPCEEGGGLGETGQPLKGKQEI